MAMAVFGETVHGEGKIQRSKNVKIPYESC